MPEPMVGVGLYVIVKPIKRTPTPREISLFERRTLKNCPWGSDIGYVASVSTVLEALADHNIVIKITPLGLNKKFSPFCIVAFHYHTKTERARAEVILEHLGQPKIKEWFCWQ
jgi:hypothetical protein